MMGYESCYKYISHDFAIYQNTCNNSVDSYTLLHILANILKLDNV